MIELSLVGYAGLLFILLFLFQMSRHFRSWSFNDYFGTFFIFFIILGVGFSSMAFPAFRSKESSMAYLMLPASVTEKFIMEFLIHIIGYIIVMPVLFICVAFLESAVIHAFYRDFELFSFSTGYSDMLRKGFPTESKNIGVIIGYLLFILILFFTGASYFSKSPLLKTILVLIVISILFSLYSALLAEVFNLPNVSNKNVAFTFNYSSAFALPVINLSLLAIAYFKLKEKEV